MNKKPFTPYEWPEELFPLRDWLQHKGVDVHNLKSERQAAFMAKELGKQKIKLPSNRRQFLFPILQKLQDTLCPKQMMSARRGDYERHRDRNLGTFGDASPVRHIDPATYMVKS